MTSQFIISNNQKQLKQNSPTPKKHLPTILIQSLSLTSQTMIEYSPHLIDLILVLLQPSSNNHNIKKMPPPRINLTWSNISASINQKPILQHITGYCSPGNTLAIMGPSGSGKTTLLSVLSKKYTNRVKVTGQVKANNQEYDHKEFYNFASFVYQQDILSDSLTVRQTLQFTAKLTIQNQQKALQRVDQLINDFNLYKCQNTYIGGKLLKGISGGQKKRVCIALQMISQPDLLILDQPTSGLDSHMANTLIKLFTKLAKKQQRAIIFSIHQPSHKIYSQLDRLLLLDKGSCIYQGPASAMLQYLTSLGIVIPSQNTVCDYFMFEISQHKARTQHHQTKLTNISYNSHLEKNIQLQLNNISQHSNGGYPTIQVHSMYEKQLYLLFQRQIKIMLRDPMNLIRILLSNLLMILLIGLVFLDRIAQNRPSTHSFYSPLSLQFYFIEAQGTMFVSICVPILSGVFAVALVFPQQRQIFYKQLSSKIYQVLPYYLSKTIPKIIGVIFCQIVYVVGSYWMLGFTNDFSKFMKYILIQCELCFMGCGIGFLTSTIFRTVEHSSTLTPTLLIPLMLFSGLHNKLKSIPSWIAWFQYFSPFRYGLQASLLCQYQNQQYCIPCPQDISECCSYYNYQTDFIVKLTYWQNIFWMGIASLGYYILGFIFLKIGKSKLVP